MSHGSFSTEAIILSKKNFGESDRILVLYTKNFGQLTVLAKGVRKPKSRKRGHLEIFSHIRFSASGGKGFDIMTEVETVNSFDEIRMDLKRTTVGYYLCEVLFRLTREGQHNEEVYFESLRFLNELGVSDNLKSLRKKFMIRTLVHLGFLSESSEINDPDRFLEEVLERKVNSVRVGKAILN